MKVIGDSSQSAIARASATARLGHFLPPKSLSAITQGLKNADASVRMAAVGALTDADLQARLTLLPPLLTDETRLVRMDTARALAGEAEQGLKPEDHRAFENAIAEYIAAQTFNAERPESQVNLGALYMARGQFAEAEAALTKAIELDPTFLPAPITLAELHRARGEESAAEATLRQALKRNPNAAALLHALGLSLVRQKRTEEALASLAQAAKLAPDEPRYAYVTGVALHDSGKPAEGLEVLKAALIRHPYDRDILFAPASYELETGDYASARSRAELANWNPKTNRSTNCSQPSSGERPKQSRSCLVVGPPVRPIIIVGRRGRRRRIVAAIIVRPVSRVIRPIVRVAVPVAIIVGSPPSPAPPAMHFLEQRVVRHGRAMRLTDAA